MIRISTADLNTIFTSHSITPFHPAYFYNTEGERQLSILECNPLHVSQDVIFQTLKTEYDFAILEIQFPKQTQSKKLLL